MQKNRYKIPDQPNKIVFSQSWLSEFFTCPLRFKLAGENTVNWDSEATRQGNLFERLVLGDFDGKLKDYSYRKGAATQEMIERCANDFIEGYVFPNYGNVIDPQYVQEEMIIDVGRFGIGGCLDYRGPLLDNIDCINDLKFCKSPMSSTFYNPLYEAKGVKEVLQPIVYSYLVWKKEGAILPFRRIVVSPLGDGCHVWVKEFKCDQETFSWLEGQLNSIYDKYIMGFLPAADEEANACYSRKQGSCKYLPFCSVGKSRIFTNDVIDVNEFLEIGELTY